jgi:muramidase (phage lysozyme)
VISPTLAQFLSLIAFSEGTSTGLDNGYGVIVSGTDGPHTFTDYSQHPFASGRVAIQVVAPGTRFPDGLYSTASGRYQFILPTWRSLQARLNLPDFSPVSQDAACIELLRQKGAIDLILAGNIQGAIEACSSIWASFPNNEYAQGGHTLGNLLEVWPTLAVSS